MTLFGRKRQIYVLSAIVLLLIIFFVSRLTNLTKIPIFTDEAIYIRWSQIGAADANWRFISLTDGKQPMFTWIMMVLLRVMPADPLFIGRLVSVIAGAASVVGIGLLGAMLFNNVTIGFISSLLYTISPFSLMYDRMALYDSLVATFSIWSLYLAVLLVRKVRLDVALILGMMLGLGMLNKTSGFFSLYLLPTTLILFDIYEKRRFQRLVQWFLYALTAAIISQLLYSILRLSPFFHIISQKDAVFVYPFKEWMTHPFLFLQGNLRGMFDWLRHYFTLPVFAASLLALFIPSTRKKEEILLYIWWIVPFIGLASFAKILYPRFILFMAMPLQILAALMLFKALLWVKNVTFRNIILLAFFVPSLITDYFIVVNPVYAPIPYADKGQYINDWPSGWGIAEVNAYLTEQSKDKKIYVITDGTFGLLPYGIEIYLISNPNVNIHGIWPLPQDVPPEVINMVKNRPTYLVVNQTKRIPEIWNLELIRAYPKGNPNERPLRLFKVLQPEESKSAMQNSRKGK